VERDIARFEKPEAVEEIQKGNDINCAECEKDIDISGVKNWNQHYKKMLLHKEECKEVKN